LLLLWAISCVLTVDFPGSPGVVAWPADSVDDTGVILPGPGPDDDVPLNPLTATFADLELGETYVGCDVRVAVRIQNPTIDPISVVDVLETRPNPELWLDMRTEVHGDLPWELRPGDEKTVVLAYSPLSEGTDADGFIVVLDPDVLGELRLDVRGSAVPWAQHEESVTGATDRIELEHVPVPETLDLSVDGVRRTSGFEWDAAENCVLLDPPLDAGQVLRVGYSQEPQGC
jgi:hypothetical protein